MKPTNYLPVCFSGRLFWQANKKLTAEKTTLIHNIIWIYDDSIGIFL